MKTLKNLTVPVIILVVMILGLVAYNVFVKKEVPSDTLESTEAVKSYLLNYTSDMISSVVISSSDGSEYSVSASDKLADGSMTWSYMNTSLDHSQYAMSQPYLAAFVSAMSSFKINQEVTSGKDTFAEYGLDEPLYTINISLTTGEKHSLYIGNNTHDDASVYCTLDDTGTVYTIDVIKATKCKSTILDFLDANIFSVTGNDIATISMKRPEDPVTLTMNRVQYVDENGTETGDIYWNIVEPLQHDASPVFSNLIDSLLLLSVTSFVELNPSDLSQYGLDNPAYVFDFLLNSGEKMQIILSKDMGGVYYGASTTSPAVFVLSTEQIYSLQAPLLEIIDPYLHYVFLRDIQHIEATFPEGSFYMDMDVGVGDTAVSDESSVSLDGRNAKVTSDDASRNRSYFSLLFEAISVIKISEMDFISDPINTKDISIIITKTNTEQIVIDLAVRDENTYYAFIDGVYQKFIINKAELYQDNGSDFEDYGIWPAYVLLDKAIDNAFNGVYVLSDS
jgi:hypothetical protein